LADFILDNKVIEYIMGPESHHELIRRSANITGFLLVTQTITPGIHQALWQPIAENKDPRIFQATLAMHQDMITNMNLSTLVGLSERLSTLPFSSFDSHVIDFVCRLMEQIKSNIYSHQQHQQQHQQHMVLLCPVYLVSWCRRELTGITG
jgi:ubiquitin carboxyl-terminal hydrolase 34